MIRARINMYGLPADFDGEKWVMKDKSTEDLLNATVKDFGAEFPNQFLAAANYAIERFGGSLVYFQQMEGDNKIY